ncbi:MAG: tripartite tricarboxylate transporter substrate binding protein [Desulfovibrionaceae bacterium]|nr:tripartite tricarboxylate transporter substrate binding protein [Desulfovibrionaceae bacterium]
MKVSRALLLLIFGLVIALPGIAPAAENYPTRPITFIIPYPPGGNAEIALRPLVEAVGRELNANFVVTPMPGAGAMTGLSKALSSKPDGYTLFVGAYTNFTIASQLRPVRFTWETPEYIGTVTNVTMYLGVDKENNKFPDFQSLVDYAKANPGKLNVAQVGNAGIHQIMSLRLMKKLGISFQPVPFDGGPPCVAAVLGGHADALYTDNYNPALRPLFLGAAPSEYYPGVPTLAELGHEDIAMGIFYVIGAPQGTPKPILEKLEKAFEKAVQAQEYKDRLATLKWEPIWRDAAETRAAIAKEAAAVKQLIDEGLLQRAE